MQTHSVRGPQCRSCARIYLRWCTTPGSSPRALLLLPSPRRPPFEPPHLTPHPLCRCRSSGATAAPPLLPPQPRRCCVQRRPPPRPARVCTPVLRVGIPLPEKESKVLRPESRRGGGYLRTHGCGKSCQLFYFLWITFWQTQEPASGTFFYSPAGAESGPTLLTFVYFRPQK